MSKILFTKRGKMGDPRIICEDNVHLNKLKIILQVSLLGMKKLQYYCHKMAHAY